MKIVIISDIHDNLVNLEKCLNWCKNEKIEHLICCGDVTNSETLQFLSKKFKGRIYLVQSNVEIYEEEETTQFKNIEYFGNIGKVKVNGKAVGICHEPYTVDEVIEKYKCDIIFYGHTHKPWEEERNGVKIINPGTLGGVFAKATFATYDTESGEMELKLLELL
jgi:putative phosphoesterase